MCRVKLVKTAKARERLETIDADIISQLEEKRKQHETQLNEGTKVCKELCLPWANSDRVVVADSYFASVQTAQEMKRVGLRFIGVVKTATKKFPMHQLQSCQLNKRGDHKSLHFGRTTENTMGMVCDMMAFTWVDRDRRNFIATCSNLRPAEPIFRE